MSFCFELALDAAKLFLGLGAAGAAVVLDLADFLERGDEVLVRLLERLQINDAALGLLRDLDRAGVQRLGVAQQEPVRHIGNGAGGFHRLLGVIHAQPQHHLALPEGDGVHDGGLDLLGHEKVVILDHADLRGHLQGDRAGQLQIVQLLLKAADEVREIVHGLRVLGQTGLLRLRAQLGEILFAQLLHAELARDDVHRELLEIRLIELEHAVERGDVLREDDLVVLQLLGDLVHVDLGLVELRLRLLHGAGGLFEETAETFLLLGFVVVEILQLHDEAREHVADLAHVLRAYLAERGAGEIGNVLLRGGAVGKNKIGIGHVDLLGKLAHGGAAPRGRDGQCRAFPVQRRAFPLQQRAAERRGLPARRPAWD